MFPVLLELGPLKIHSYGLMIAIGFLVTLFFIERDAKRRDWDPNVFRDCAFWALVLGVVGSRVAHIFMYPEFYSWSDPVGWIAVWKGGLVFQGALLPSGVFVYWFLKKHGIQFMPAADILFPYLALGHGLGRIGCFLYGCCYGRPTDFFLGIPARRVPWDTTQDATGSPAYLDYLELNNLGRLHDAHWSHAVHPSQLYSMVGLFAICATLLWMRKHWNPFPGFTFPMYLILYGGFRFVVEFFRGDHNPTVGAASLSISQQQLYSLGFVVIGIVLFQVFRRRSADVATPPEAP